MFIKKNRVRISVIAALFCGFLFSAASIQAATKLRWKLKNGQVFQHSTSTETVSTVNTGGNNVETKMTQKITLEWKVVSVDDKKVAKIEQIILRVQMDMTSPGVTLSIDTDSDKEPGEVGKLVFPTFKALIKSKPTFSMDARGKISNVAFSKEFLKEIQAIPDASQFGGLLSNKGLKQMVSQGSLNFPEKSMSKGYKWSQKMEIGFGGTTDMKFISDYTYQGPAADGQEKIDLEMKIVSKKLKLPNGVEMTINDQKMTGSLHFDNKKGYLLGSKMLQTTKMEMSVLGQKTISEIKTTITTKITLKNSTSKSPKKEEKKKTETKS